MTYSKSSKRERRRYSKSSKRDSDKGRWRLHALSRTIINVHEEEEEEEEEEERGTRLPILLIPHTDERDT